MSLAMTLFSLITAWLSIAMALLWGVLRIAHRHQPGDRHTTDQPPRQGSQGQLAVAGS